jgi:hypothetical protein
MRERERWINREKERERWINRDRAISKRRGVKKLREINIERGNREIWIKHTNERNMESGIR